MQSQNTQFETTEQVALMYAGKWVESQKSLMGTELQTGDKYYLWDMSIDENGNNYANGWSRV